MTRTLQIPRSTPIVEEVTGLTPWEAFVRLADQPRVLFLDTAAPSPRSRASYLLADPFDWIESPTRGFDPFPLVQERLRSFRVEPIPGLPALQGGIAGLFGFDLVHHLERLPRPRHDDLPVPDLAAGLYDWVLSFDHQTGRAWLVSTGLPELDESRRRNRAQRRLAQVRRLLDRPPSLPAWRRVPPVPLGTPAHGVPTAKDVSSNFSAQTYGEMIRRGIEYVHAGDCFQVNLAQRLMTPQTEPAWALYQRLRERNSAPFAGYFDLGDAVLASASPERFLEMSRRHVHTCPIKGTRPHGLTEADDLRLRQELEQSPKDRAENVMIVDLLRNDLGRVCEYGSIQVPALCQVETFRYVHHLVSEVAGTLRPGCDAVDLLRAAFPGGSVTGAPKIRALEIIAELEQTRRGPYCGALGYLGFDGSMDTNILIRTFVIAGGWVSVSVGGGIVADSDPEREYAETWHKAEGMLRTLRM